MRIGRYAESQSNAGAMADIAFLLLVFFMVTTVIPKHEGLLLRLPPHQEDVPIQPIPDRNLYTIRINSFDQVMVEGEIRTNLSGLKTDIKTFILNRGHDPKLATSREKAIVSLHADRGCTHRKYIEVLDEIQAAYYDMYADQAGLSPAAFRALDLRNKADLVLYERGRSGIPMNISISSTGLR